MSMASNASKDRAAVEESLRAFGFGDKGIEAVFSFEDSTDAGVKAKKRAKPVEQTALDFGDWE